MCVTTVMDYRAPFDEGLKQDWLVKRFIAVLVHVHYFMIVMEKDYI